MNLNPLRAMSLAGGCMATQMLLDNASHVTYTIRDWNQVRNVPDTRKADYGLRNFYASLTVPCLMETAFRLIDSRYTRPITLHELGMNRLTEDYGKPDGIHGHFPKATNYTDRMPRPLEKFFLGNTATTTDNHLLPRLLREQAEKAKTTPQEKAEYELLAHHMERRFDFENAYLETLQRQKGTITELEKSQIRQGLKEAKKYLEAHEQSLTNKEHFAELQNWIKSQNYPGKVAELVEDGLSSKRAQEVITGVQKSAIWPKTGLNLLFSMIFMGVIINFLDIRKVQPWQDKLVEKRGSSKEVETPLYWSMIPGGAAMIGTMMAFGKRMGYLSRFMTAAAAGLTTYTACVLLTIKNRLSKPPTQQASGKQTEGAKSQPPKLNQPQQSPALAPSLTPRSGLFQSFASATQPNAKASP